MTGKSVNNVLNRRKVAAQTYFVGNIFVDKYSITGYISRKPTAALLFAMHACGFCWYF